MSLHSRQLRFLPNNSLYTIGNEVRYVEYYYEEDSRKHRISSVTTTDYPDRNTRFCRLRQSIPQMVDLICRSTWIGRMHRPLSMK